MPGANAGWPLQQLGAQGESVGIHRLFFPVLKDGSVVQIVFGRAFNRVVDFARGGGGGQRNAELVAEFEGQAQIFVHQAQREAAPVTRASASAKASTCRASSKFMASLMVCPAPFAPR